MDGNQLIASIVQSVFSLAWPVAFLAAVLIFRHKVTELLPLLRLKYKELDVSFLLDQGEKEAKTLKPIDPDQTAEPSAEETDNFLLLATSSPAAAVLERYRDVEQAIQSLAEAAGLDTSKIRRPSLYWTRELQKKKLLDEGTSALLRDLREYRNAIAHQRWNITLENALRFDRLANEALKQIDFARVRTHLPEQ